METLKLSYNRATGHVKIDDGKTRAVVGLIEFGLTPGYRPYRFGAEVIDAKSIEELLPKIKKYHLAHPPSPYREGKGKGRRKPKINS